MLPPYHSFEKLSLPRPAEGKKTQKNKEATPWNVISLSLISMSASSVQGQCLLRFYRLLGPTRPNVKGARNASSGQNYKKHLKKKKKNHTRELSCNEAINKARDT